MAMGLSQKVMQSMISRIAASKEVIYPTLEACEKAGFLSVGTGLLLRAGSGAATEVWDISPTEDGQLRLMLRSDLGYDPELRSAKIERKVYKAAQDAVETPYGVGSLVGKTKEGSPIVAVSVNGESKRFVLQASDVRPVPEQTRVSITLQAKDPEKTSTKEYLEQYYYSAYGSEDYAKELTKSFGDLWPE
jgi:hypothetical protein